MDGGIGNIIGDRNNIFSKIDYILLEVCFEKVYSQWKPEYHGGFIGF